MRKKLASLAMVLCCIVCLMSGCDLFKYDQEGALSHVVYEVGDYQVTKEKLLVTYNNYASTLNQQYLFYK